MPYAVKLGGVPAVVVAATGAPVPNSVVGAISFPTSKVNHMGQAINVISGPGSATIFVGGQQFTGVPLL